jgi:hypothetical protein
MEQRLKLLAAKSKPSTCYQFDVVRLDRRSAIKTGPANSNPTRPQLACAKSVGSSVKIRRKIQAASGTDIDLVIPRVTADQPQKPWPVTCSVGYFLRNT